MSLKVSAIVPVYNPGADIEDCIRTLVDQSLPRDEYEVIFVDDGSTDGTGARLDALAAEHPHVRVEHIENSGWPGRPRNVGLDLARGEFVFFVDNDDYVGRGAFERLYAAAVEDDADVVMGKVVGHGPGKYVANGIFRRNRSGLTFEWRPLLYLLSPHKLFRRALLDEHGIRFPVEKTRLEDHLFVMHAYFHAQGRISVVADLACYHWMFRARDANASMTPFDPPSYFGAVRRVLDLVDEHTEPGALRDRLYAHWYRGKMLGRVGGRPFLRWSADYRRARYEEIHRLALERFDPAIDAFLPLHLRVRSRALRAGSLETLVALARAEVALEADVDVHDLQREGDDLVLALEAGLSAPGGGIARFLREGERLVWAAPGELAGVLGEPFDATDDLRKGDAHVFLRSRRDQADWPVPLRQELRLVPAGDDGAVRPVLAATGRISAATGAAGAPLDPGEYAVLTGPVLAGFRAQSHVRHPPGGPALVVRVGEDGRVTPRRFDLRTRLSRGLPRVAALARRARGGA